MGPGVTSSGPLGSQQWKNDGPKVYIYIDLLLGIGEGAKKESPLHARTPAFSFCLSTEDFNIYVRLLDWLDPSPSLRECPQPLGLWPNRPSFGDLWGDGQTLPLSYGQKVAATRVLWVVTREGRLTLGEEVWE